MTRHTPTKGNDMATEASTTDTRVSEQGDTFSAELIQGFLLTALSHDAVADKVNDLLFKHVVEGQYHPSVITESLRPIIQEVLETATHEDWAAVTRQLTAKARESLGEAATSA
jgi:hypothetical protein